MTALNITFTPDGSGHCLYSELLDLQSLGALACTRATEIEFNPNTQRWEVRPADSSKLLFSHQSRQACLVWEQENVEPEPEPQPEDNHHERHRNTTR
jgi:hypothetical protein